MTAFPISIEHVPTDYWTIGSVVASAVVAAFTAWLASSTWSLAQETKKMAQKTTDLAEQTAKLASETAAGIRVADRHHQELLRPFVTIRADLAIATSTFYGPEVESFVLEGLLVNAGSGPSLDVRLTLTPLVTNVPHDFNLGSIGANSSQPLKDVIIPIPDTVRPDASRANPYNCEISYDGSFGGSIGVTKMTSHSGKAIDLQIVDGTNLPGYILRDLG